MNGYSRRASDIMLRAQTEQRRSTRTAVNVTGTVAYDGDRGQHLALTRDLCAGGAFFYCECKPELGERLTFTCLMPAQGRTMRMTARGRVVRVESFPGSKATGVATQFDEALSPTLEA